MKIFYKNQHGDEEFLSKNIFPSIRSRAISNLVLSELLQENNQYTGGYKYFYLDLSVAWMNNLNETKIGILTILEGRRRMKQ